MIRLARQARTGIPVRDDLWLDEVLDKVGPCGSFLGERSTRAGRPRRRVAPQRPRRAGQLGRVAGGGIADHRRRRPRARRAAPGRPGLAAVQRRPGGGPRGAAAPRRRRLLTPATPAGDPRPGTPRGRCRAGTTSSCFIWDTVSALTGSRLRRSRACHVPVGPYNETPLHEFVETRTRRASRALSRRSTRSWMPSATARSSTSRAILPEGYALGGAKTVAGVGKCSRPDHCPRLARTATADKARAARPRPWPRSGGARLGNDRRSARQMLIDAAWRCSGQALQHLRDVDAASSGLEGPYV